MTHLTDNNEYRVALKQLETLLESNYDNLSVNDKKELKALSILLDEYESSYYPI